MAELTKLIERLEQAQGPDREIDVRLWAIHDGYEVVSGVEGDHVLHRRKDGSTFMLKAPYAAPLFTASIDAAITLVPNDQEFEVGNGNDRIGAKPWAQVWPKDQPFPVELEFYADGMTAAIALCIAALKARQQALVPVAASDR